MVLPLCTCQAFTSSRIMIKRSSIVLRQPSRVGHTSDAELWKPTPRVAQRCCPRIPPSNTQEPARCHLPNLDQKLSTPGSSTTAVPLGDIGPKPVGCIYSLHPGCHTCRDIRLRLPCIGFPITKTPSKGVSFVASRSCPSLCGCAGCWPKAPSTTMIFARKTAVEIISRGVIALIVLDVFLDVKPVPNSNHFHQVVPSIQPGGKMAKLSVLPL